MAELKYKNDIREKLLESGDMDLDVFENTISSSNATELFKVLSNVDDETFELLCMGDSGIGIKLEVGLIELEFDLENDTIIVLDKNNINK